MMNPSEIYSECLLINIQHVKEIDRKELSLAFVHIGIKYKANSENWIVFPKNETELRIAILLAKGVKP